MLTWCTVPQEVYISEAQPEGTRADVSWDINAEDKCSTDIAHFIIFYRETDKDLLYSKFTISIKK